MSFESGTSRASSSAPRRLARDISPSLSLSVYGRYPTFQDALRDMDDALSMLALYSGLPSGVVSYRTVAFSRRLLLEFHGWVLRERSLRKVFVSIKGIYYQADISGFSVTWVIPHKFVQTVRRRAMAARALESIQRY